MSSKWRDRRRYTLAFRLGLWYAILFALGSTALIGLTYVLLASSLKQRDHALIQSTLERYATEYGERGLAGLDRAIQIDRGAGRHESLFVRVLNRRAEALFFNVPGDWGGLDLSPLDRDTAGPTPESPSSESGAQQWLQLQGRRGQAVLEVASLRLTDGTLLQVGKSSESRAELLEQFRSLALLVLAAMIGIGLVGGALLTHWGLQPVRDLAATVGTITQTGQLDARVPVRDTGDALDDLSRLVNELLTRIQSHVSGMRGALDNVAHDLRTPLARLRSTAEAALRSLDAPGSSAGGGTSGGGGVEAAREALAGCLEEAERVESMVHTLMDISEAETGAMKLKRTRVSVAKLLHGSRELYADVAEDANVDLQIAPDADGAGVVVDADEGRLRQVVANLLDNAIKYTPAGGRVRLSAVAADGQLALSVEDTGIGIAPQDLPRIWDRLYRGDASRSARGLGLGLSLVRAIVAAHGGTVDVQSAPGDGATFTVRLPLESAAPPANPA